MKFRLIFAALALSTAASGYYHFVHYLSRNAPFTAIPEKFDLSALQDKTIAYHIADNGPISFAAGDTFLQVVSQIRAAAKVWNDVDSSDLRVRFGGLAPVGSTQNATTPNIDIVFDDLPPGVNGYGAPTIKNDIINSPSGAFVPIQRSVVILSRDISTRPSWSEAYFLTTVHEIGHALGLQHSFSGGAMATEITRATTKMRPITPDDVAGISLLYPTAAFRSGLGSISGRVASNNGAIGLASVVAIVPGGAAIGTLSQPDGSYKIDGLPAGLYYLYVHPLPPTLQGEATPGNVVLPVDAQNRTLTGGQQFDTVFYPASRQPSITVPVAAGNITEGINFTVNPRSTPPSIHSVQTYSFPGQRAVKPAHMYTNGVTRNLHVFTGYGLIQNSQPVNGLQISAMGGGISVAPGGVTPYSPAPDSYLQLEFQLGQLAAENSTHLIFSRNNDLYVLPYGIRIVTNAPPTIDTVSQRNEFNDVVLTGTGLTANTRVLFDGAAAITRGYEENTGRLTVTPPAGPSGLPAHIVAMNSDGQSNQFLQAAPVWNYDNFDFAATNLTLSTNSLPAGTESLVQIDGAGFSDGNTNFSFGTPDVTLRRLWIQSPTRALANVYVAPGAPNISLNVLTTNGLRLNTQPAALQITSPGAKTAWLSLRGNAAGLLSGSSATVQVNGNLIISNLSALQLTVNDRPATITGVDGNTVTFQVPAGLAPGVAVVRVQQGGDAALPIALPIAQPPAVISSVSAGFGIPITQDRPARQGELMNMLITGLPDSVSATGSQARININIAGVDHRPITANAIGGGGLQLQFIIQSIVPNGNQTVTVTVDNVTVQPFVLPIRPF